MYFWGGDLKMVPLCMCVWVVVPVCVYSGVVVFLLVNPNGVSTYWRFLSI